MTQSLFRSFLLLLALAFGLSLAACSEPSGKKRSSNSGNQQDATQSDEDGDNGDSDDDRPAGSGSEGGSTGSGDDDDDDDDGDGDDEDGDEDSEDDEGDDEELELEDGPDGFAADFKNSDDFFVANANPINGDSPHGRVQIWYSSNVEELLSEGDFDEVPVGTTAIKEFDNDGTAGVDGVVVMVKKEAGYDPDNNDWYYEMRDNFGTVLEEPAPGKTAMCISCHAGFDNDDYLGGLEFIGNVDAAEMGPAEFRFDYATSNEFFTKTTTPIAGASPHGSVRIWYSSNVQELIEDAEFTVPEGTVAIKQFNNDGGLGVAVMIKKEAGYDPDNGDWYYEMRDAYGNQLDEPAPGKIAMCISCHAGAAATDYLPGVTFNN